MKSVGYDVLEDRAKSTLRQRTEAELTPTASIPKLDTAGKSVAASHLRNPTTNGQSLARQSLLQLQQE